MLNIDTLRIYYETPIENRIKDLFKLIDMGKTNSKGETIFTMTIKQESNNGYDIQDYKYLLFKHKNTDEIIIYPICFKLIYNLDEDINRKDKKTISKLLYKNIQETYNIGSYLITSGF